MTRLSLTPREHEVLMRAANGCTDRETGVDLGISHKTVQAHRHNILRRLKARTITHAVYLYLVAGPGCDQWDINNHHCTQGEHCTCVGPW